MKPQLFLVVAASLLVCGVGICASLVLNHDGTDCQAWTGVTGCLCLFLGVISLDIYRLKPSRKHSAGSLFQQYVTSKILVLFGTFVSWKLRRSCKDCQKQQATLLQGILKQNGKTIFAQENGLSTIRTVEEFRSSMPLTRYGHYEKYVDIITEHGSQNVMFPFKVDYIALTSGTSKGKSKGYPKSTKIRNSNLMPWLILIVYNLASMPGCQYLKRMFNMLAYVKTKLTKSGIEQGPMSFFMSGKSIPSYCIVPPCPELTEDVSMYVYALFALQEDDVNLMSMITTTTTMTLMNTIERNWEALCDDVERGRLPSSLQMGDELRSDLNSRLQPEPARAGFLRAEFRKGFVDLVSRVWPKCRAISAIRTGSFQTQTKLLRENYAGNTPIVTALHGSTECMYGFNLDLLDEHVRYTLLLGNGLFEFIPEEEMSEDSPSTLLAHQVEIGQDYEIVITTWDGLYRYRTEDVIHVTGFLDTTPVYEFVRRAGDILSANLEKVPEVLLYDSVTKAAKGWSNSTITDFTSVENYPVENITGNVTGAGFYIVFLEMADASLLSEAEKSQVDKELRSKHDVYAAVRTSGKLQPVRVVQVKAGTFDKVDKELRSKHDVYAAVRTSGKLQPVRVVQVKAGTFDKVDKELRSRHDVYAAVRTSGKLQPVRVVQVKPGTFDKVKRHMLTSNEDAFFMQYKLPRITRRADVLKVLLGQMCVKEL